MLLTSSTRVPNVSQNRTMSPQNWDKGHLSMIDNWSRLAVDVTHYNRDCYLTCVDCGPSYDIPESQYLRCVASNVNVAFAFKIRIHCALRCKQRNVAFAFKIRNHHRSI